MIPTLVLETLRRIHVTSVHRLPTRTNEQTLPRQTRKRMTTIPEGVGRAGDMTTEGDRVTRTKAVCYFAAIALLAGGATALAVSGPSAHQISAAATSSAPSSPPVTVCGNASLLTGPASAPPGAVTVAAGNDSAQFGGTLPSSTTYWFAPGTHTLGSSEFAQIDASSNDTFIGAPGAVLNGQDENDFAIAGSGTNVTIEYLTIENFTAPESQGAVNQNLSSGWVVENSTIENNPNGAGVMVDSNGVLNDDCLTQNGQYGFQTYSGSDSVPVTNLTITNNEISYNDTRNYDTNGTGTCGCTGGAKFWNDLGATVTGNYIHDNESVGLWMDTNNTAFNVSDNYFSHNWDVAIQYEISYDVSITNNTFVDNGWIAGPNNPGTGAIEINNAGSDSRVAGAYNTQSVISGNVLTDNWGGVDIYDDSDRYCGTQSDNTSNDYCTLVNPSVYSVASCTSHDVAGATSSQNPDYYDNCRWKSQNILVSNNTFNFTPSNIGSSCTAAKGCGFVGLYSEWGTYAPYTGYAIPLALVNSQNVSFSGNTYNGPFVFDSMYQGSTVSWSQWTGGYTDPNSDAAIKPQDAGSSFNGSVTTPTTTTTTTTHPTTTTTTSPIAPTTTTTTTTHPTTTTTTTTTTRDPTTTTTTTTAPTTTTTSAASGVTVSRVSPSTGSTNGGTTVTITGTGFTGATSVHFGSASASIGSVSATSVTATAPPSAGGSVDVTVTTPSGTSQTNSVDKFTYIYPKPTVTAISPSAGAPGGGLAVTVTGTGFTGATTVSFGSAPASFTVSSNTSLTATAPAGAAKSVVDVTVTGPGGTSNVVAADEFTYGPVVTSVSPTTCSHLGGATITIKGAGFTGATAVSFGGTPISSAITVNAAGTQITVTAPAHAAGAVAVTVTVGGVTTSTGSLTQLTFI